MGEIWGSYHKEELAYQVQLWAEGSWLHNLSDRAASERAGHELIVVLCVCIELTIPLHVNRYWGSLEK